MKSKKTLQKRDSWCSFYPSSHTQTPPCGCSCTLPGPFWFSGQNLFCVCLFFFFFMNMFSFLLRGLLQCPGISAAMVEEQGVIGAMVCLGRSLGELCSGSFRHWNWGAQVESPPLELFKEWLNVTLSAMVYLVQWCSKVGLINLGGISRL